MDQIMQTVIKILIGNYNVDKSKLQQDDINMLTDLGLDSIELISLFVDMEESLNITFNEDDYDYDKIDTLQKIAHLIRGKINE